MKKLTTTISLLLVLVFTSNTRATLIDRGGGLIYDTVLNITWTQDANLCVTLGNCVNSLPPPAAGYMTWQDAKTWADNLVYQGYSDWRLAQIQGLGPTTTAVNCASPATTKAQCQTNELGYNFYYNLTPSGDADGKTDVPTSLIGNQGPFTNIQSQYYSGTLLFDANSAWFFVYEGGAQGMSFNLASPGAAWAVRPGDSVSSIPEPGAAVLLEAGLGVMWMVRRRSRR